MKTFLLVITLLGFAPRDWYGTENPSRAFAAEGNLPAVPRAQCLLFCVPDCAPCETMKRNLGTTLVPLGWKVGSEAAADIRLVDASQQEALSQSFGVDAYPTCVIVREGKEVWRKVGVVSMGELSAAINRERKVAKGN